MVMASVVAVKVAVSTVAAALKVVVVARVAVEWAVAAMTVMTAPPAAQVSLL